MEEILSLLAVSGRLLLACAIALAPGTLFWLLVIGIARTVRRLPSIQLIHDEVNQWS
jgi:hypothetical protein